MQKSKYNHVHTLAGIIVTAADDYIFEIHTHGTYREEISVLKRKLCVLTVISSIIKIILCHTKVLYLSYIGGDWCIPFSTVPCIYI